MKYVKYSLIALSICVIGFFAIGVFCSTVSYESSVTVNKPAAEAWAVLGDASKMPEWLVGFKRIEPVSGEPGTVGAVSKIYFDEGGQEMVIEETITEVVPNKSMRMDFKADFMTMDYSMDLNQAENQTILTSKTSVQGNGLFARSMVALMTSALKDQEDENMARLKAVIEKNTTDYAAQDNVAIVAPESAD